MMSSKKRAQRRGVAAVEFAFVAPVFFLVILGMIEIGRAIMVQQVLTNASREGARRAIIETSTNSEVNSLVRDYLTSCGITGADAAIALKDKGGAAIGNVQAIPFGDPITVQVSIPHSSVSWLPTARFMGSATLSASSTMHAERPQ